jgi:hypothetical protein
LNEDEAVVELIRGLNAAGIPYMLVGSFSSNFYGVPRATEDADFVLDFQTASLSHLLQNLGPQFQVNRQISFEMATGTRRNVISLEGTAFTIELFRLSEDPHDQERFRRRRLEKLLGCVACIPTAEDVIVTKLRWAHQANRRKDVDDVRDVIAVQGDRIDWAYVATWCDLHGTRPLLDQVRASIPPV